MANYELMDTNIDSFPLKGKDAAGDFVPLPAGTQASAKVSDPASLNVTIDATGMVSMNALKPAPVLGVSVEFDDGTLTPFTMVVDIVADLTPTSVAPDLSTITHASQPAPI